MNVPRTPIAKARRAIRGLAAAAAALAPAIAGAQILPACLAEIPIAPSGVSADAGDLFATEQDYRWVHSSTHLQGRRAHEKWAWGFFLPPAGGPFGLFAGFRTAVVVDNPDPSLAAIVDIE